MRVEELTMQVAMMIDGYANDYHAYRSFPPRDDAELSKEQEALAIKRRELAHIVALGLCIYRGVYAHEAELEFLQTAQGEDMEYLPPLGWLDE